jgi:integrase
MPQVKFTQKVIDKLPAPDPSGSQQLHWDTDMEGFGVLCSGKTNIKSYVVRGTINGRDIRKAFERVDRLSLAEARIKAKAMMVSFAGGNDPRAIKRNNSDVTLRQALESYLSKQRLKPRSQAGMRDIVERHLAGWLDLPLFSISREMVENRHQQIAQEVEQRYRAKAAEDAKRHLVRAERTETSWREASARHRARYEAAKARQPNKGYATANGVMGALRALWNYMADRADHDPGRNPVRLKKQWHPVKARTRVLRAEDLPMFYTALMALENKVARDYILLKLFTGLRRREASSLRWKEDIDFHNRLIDVPLTKSDRPLKLPMSDVVHEMLVARGALGRTKYVFPAPSKSGYIEEPKFHFQQIAGVTGVRVSSHDLRRTFITIAASCGIREYLLRALVNHSLGRDVTSGYIQMLAEELREPVQRVADKLKELCGIMPIGGDNVEILKQRDR